MIFRQGLPRVAQFPVAVNQPVDGIVQIPRFRGVTAFSVSPEREGDDPFLCMGDCIGGCVQNQNDPACAVAQFHHAGCGPAAGFFVRGEDRADVHFSCEIAEHLCEHDGVALTVGAAACEKSAVPFFRFKHGIGCGDHVKMRIQQNIRRFARNGGSVQNPASVQFLDRAVQPVFRKETVHPVHSPVDCGEIFADRFAADQVFQQFKVDHGQILFI